MKKKLLTIILGLASTVAFGQIEAGTKILTGTFSFYSDNDKVEPKGGTAVETPSSSFTIAPSFGYMFKENLGAGIGIGYMSTSTGEDTNEYKTGIFNVNLFARYYMPVAGDKLFFHTDFVLGFGSGSNEQGSYTQDVSTLAVGLRPGWDYFIGDKWALTLNWGWLGYSSYKVSDDGGDRTNTSFGLDVDFSTFGMGASWFF